jgi:transcription elongation factor Elf1
MTTSKQNSIEVLNELGSCREKEDSLFNNNCPHCYSQKTKIHSRYQTKSNGERKMLICEECGSYFSET